NANNVGSSGSTVAPSPNTYTLIASATSGGSTIDAAAYGSTVDLEATLSPHTGSGTGDNDLVTFQIGNQSASAVTNGSGVASTTLTLDQPTGSYTLAASYAGDADDQAATYSESFTIGPEPTILQVTAPSELISGTAGDASGDQLSAALTAGGTALPFQTVVFDIDNTSSNVVVASTTGETNGSGVADAQPFTVPPGDVGDQFTVVAYYGQSSIPAPGGQPAVDEANPDYGASSSSASIEIVDPTTTTIAASPMSSVYGQGVTLTATVTPPPPNGDGTVNFVQDGSITVCAGEALDSSGNGTATCQLANGLPVGASTFTASYSGEQGSYLPSSGPNPALPVNVGKAPTTTTLTAPTAGSFGPYGASVSLAATVSVTSPGAGTPTGTVTFMNGGTTIGTGTMSGGVATASVSSLKVGLASLTAVYSSDGNFSSSTSTSVGYTVKKASTTTALTAATATSAFGTSVSLTAKVSVTNPGGGTPTGSIAFLDGTSVIETVTSIPASGLVTVPVSGLQAGAQSFTASYGGDGNFTGSTSQPLTNTVTFTNTISGGSSGSLTVISGESLLITGSVSGNITVNSGGALEVDNGKVSGSITATGAVGFTLCGATVSGAVSVSKSTGFVLIGGGSGTGCTKSTISGSVTLSGNTAGVELASNTISGPVSVTNNSGTGPSQLGGLETEVTGNTISGSLSCSGNTPPPGVTDAGVANKASSKSGQCATL
ncbi:MAG TPA: Ig-like domain-containing protein, partial [Acidimicrobiales bacterium]|nr:Ig-like domain-containing protein [Acidimicrobiales bacterium]